MRIGLTYDLRSEYLAQGYEEEATAEFDSERTLEALESALASLGHDPERIGGIKALVQRLADGGGARWDLVFNIAEGLRGFGRESAIPALLDAYGIAYTFSDPLVLALSLHKGMTKRVMRDLGLPTAAFAVVEEAEEAARVELAYPLFVKPVAEGTSKGVSVRSKVHDRAELERECARLIEKFRQPVLVEEFLPGREVTVGLIGTGDAARAVGALEISLRGGAECGSYTYHAKEHWQKLVELSVPRDDFARQAEALALATWRGLGCRDAGRVDLRADRDGKWCVMEVNPLPGLNPFHSDLPILCGRVGMSYRELIGRIVESAMARVEARDAAGSLEVKSCPGAKRERIET